MSNFSLTSCSYYVVKIIIRWTSEGHIARSAYPIIEMFDALDSSDNIPPVHCEAFDLLRLPSLSPDPVAEQINSNSQTLKMLVSAIERQQSYATVASTEPHPQSSPLLSTSHSQKYLIMPAAQKDTFRPSAQDGRESNVILFGLAETESLVEVKSTVDELLEFLSGKQVEIKDMFRLGRYKQSATRPCPLLIKLSTGWDRKLILLRKRDLRNFCIKRLFYVKM